MIGQQRGLSLAYFVKWHARQERTSDAKSQFTNQKARKSPQAMQGFDT